MSRFDQFTTNRPKAYPYAIYACQVPAFMGTILRSSSSTMGRQPGTPITRIYDAAEYFEILALGGTHVKEHEGEYAANEIVVGSCIESRILGDMWVKSSVGSLATNWQMLSINDAMRMTDFYSLDTMTVDRSMASRSFAISSGRGAAKTSSVTNIPDPGFLYASLKGVNVRFPIYMECDTLMDYIGKILGPILCTPEAAQELITIYDHLPLDKIVKYSLQIIRSRPRSIKLRVNSISTDALHVCFAAYMIKNYKIRTGKSDLTGASAYASELLQTLSTHVESCSAPVSGFDLAYNHDWVIPHPQVVQMIIRYVASMSGEVPMPPQDDAESYLSPLFKKSKKAAFSFVVNTFPHEIPFHFMIFDKEVFFFTDLCNGPDINAYINEIEKNMAPWLVANPNYADDFRAAQERYFECLLTTSRPHLSEYARPGGIMSMAEIPIQITPGWFASMVGVQIVDEVNDIIGCLNFTDLHGKPTIMRGGRQANVDDMSNEDKDRYGRLFMQQFETNGLKLSNVPTSFEILKNMYLLNANGIPTLFTRYVNKDKNYVWKEQYKCPGGYLQLFIKLEVYQPADLGEDPRADTVRGEGLMLGTHEVIAPMFQSLSNSGRLRASAIMKNFDDELTVVPNPTIYNEDRDVFKILCEIARRCPSLLTRTVCAFKVRNGPILWDMVHPLIANSSPIHFPWNIHAVGRVQFVDETKMIFASPRLGTVEVPNTSPNHATMYNIYRERCKFSDSCDKCASAPILRHSGPNGCGRVAFCARCGPQRECPGCGQSCRIVKTPDGITSDEWKVVPAAPTLRLNIGERRIEIDPAPPLFPWQAESVARLTSFARQTEMIWLSPGAGKTRIVMDYLIWCNDNLCMTKYMLWVTPAVTIGNLTRQLRVAGIPYTVHETRSEAVIPGIVNIVKHVNFSFMDRTELGRIANEMTFILDEFHLSMTRTTKISEMSMQLAKSAFRTIPMSGTIYKNSGSYGDLANFLGLCVDFQVSNANVQVALGLMCTYKIPSKSMIRRSSKKIDFDHRLYPEFEHNNYNLAAVILGDMILADIKKSIEEEVGVVVVVQTVTQAQEYCEKLWNAGIDVIMQTSASQFTIGPGVAPDPRGPGIVAKDEYVVQEMEKEVSALTLAGAANAGPRAGPPARQYRVTPDSLLALCRKYERGAIPGASNESYRLPHVVVVPSNCSIGYDMNRYRRMFMMTLPMNVATIGQLEGRIDRSNNDSPFIEYVTYYLAAHESIFSEHELQRAKADAMRDTQEGEDAYRRVYDAAWFKERLREAEEAKSRAHNASTNRAGGPNPAVSSACAFFKITYTPISSALRDAGRKAWRKLLLQYHPDKWAGASPQDSAAAEEMAKLINHHYAILEREWTRLESL